MKYLILLPTFILGACAHIEPPPVELYTQAASCYDNVRMGIQSSNSAKVQRLAKVGASANELSIPLMVMAEALADMSKGDLFASCDDAIVSHNQAEAQTVTSVNRTIQKGVMIGGTVWAVDSIGDTLVGLGTAGGTTITANGSRITSGNTGDGTFSSSGTGLGLGNTFGGNQAQGGLEPRGNLAGDVVDHPASNSGADAPVTIPPVAETLPE